MASEELKKFSTDNLHNIAAVFDAKKLSLDKQMSAAAIQGICEELKVLANKYSMANSLNIHIQND